MRTFTCVVAATFIAFMGTENALADAEEGQGFLSVMGSYIDDDEDRDVDDGFRGGHLGIGFAATENWNWEAYISAAILEADGGLDQDHLGIGIDLQRVFRRGEKFSPYIHGGLGFIEIDPAGSVSDENGLMASAGLGFLLDVFDSNVALRGEWRYRRETASDPDDLTDNLFSLGLLIPFGEGTPKFVDSDGDGVADGMDRCPNTPAGASVDSFGCELDSDGDGVKDSRDKCPGTPRGVTVDADGCPVDTDGDNDGVVDRLDECPNSAPGVQVDIKGCEIKEEINLRGVNFETNSDRLLPGATRILDEAVATLKKNPTIRFEVAGHTDSDGAAAYNEGLSARRATTVHDYLASNGIAEDRMTVRGYGESQPIADNATSAGKAENRRVVLRITDR